MKDTFFFERSTLDQLERLESGSFLPQARGRGRHRSRREATDIGMVTSICHEEDRLVFVAVEDLEPFKRLVSGSG